MVATMYREDRNKYPAIIIRDDLKVVDWIMSSHDLNSIADSLMYIGDALSGIKKVGYPDRLYT